MLIKTKIWTKGVLCSNIQIINDNIKEIKQTLSASLSMIDQDGIQVRRKRSPKSMINHQFFTGTKTFIQILSVLTVTMNLHDYNFEFYLKPENLN